MGIIYDFAGSYTINKGFLAFGRPILILKYNGIQEKDKWDRSIELTNQEFGNKAHGIISNNCYDYVCKFLNEYEETNKWTRLSLWIKLMSNSRPLKYLLKDDNRFFRNFDWIMVVGIPISIHVGLLLIFIYMI